MSRQFLDNAASIRPRFALTTVVRKTPCAHDSNGRRSLATDGGVGLLIRRGRRAILVYYLVQVQARRKTVLSG